MNAQLEQKRAFVRALAKYLVASQAEMSIKLEAGNPHATIWRDVRQATPLRGYPTVADAEVTLAAWLGIELPGCPHDRRDADGCVICGASHEQLKKDQKTA